MKQTKFKKFTKGLTFELKMLLFKRSVDRKTKNRIKYAFQTFFEGQRDFEDANPEAYWVKPIVKMKIDILQITEIEIYRISEQIFFKITLGRPGMLIGKGGRTLDSLTEFISKGIKKPFKILIEESNIWNIN